MEFTKRGWRQLSAVLLIGLAGVIQGCATPKYNYVPAMEHISEPAIGSVNTVYIGESMLRQGTAAEHEAIQLLGELKIGMMGYTLMPGQYIKHGQDADAEYYVPGGNQPGQVIKTALADPWKSIMVKKGRPSVCVVSAFNTAMCNDNAQFRRIKVATSESNSFQQTLLYNGVVGNKINIGYREFSSNLARPAFNNDVEYDLSSSSIIGYKGARLEVLRATNEYIQYRVLQNFNPAR